MEPMTLGSPTSGSPASNSTYLPSFLLGDSTPTTPRSNTLSPEKAGRNISFAASSSFNVTPQHGSEFGNRSMMLHQRSAFAGSHNAPGTTPLQASHLNNSVNTSGPPTQDLFDSLRNERNQVQTPTTLALGNTSILQSPQQFNNYSMQSTHNSSVLGLNANTSMNNKVPSNFQQNESYLNNTGPRITSPLGVGGISGGGGIMMNESIATPNASIMHQSFSGNQSISSFNNFWVTVFGFPPNSSSNVLYHFAQCGTIIDKVFAPQGGNWVHLKYSSRLECDKALNYNEKIIMNNIMIGVTHCKEQNILDKENLNAGNIGISQTPKIRSLANTAYLAAQSDISVNNNNRPAAKSNSILHKAVDLLFG